MTQVKGHRTEVEGVKTVVRSFAYQMTAKRGSEPQANLISRDLTWPTALRT